MTSHLPINCGMVAYKWHAMRSSGDGMRGTLSLTPHVTNSFPVRSCRPVIADISSFRSSRFVTLAVQISFELSKRQEDIVVMSEIQNNFVKSNDEYSKTFDKGHLPLPPGKKYLVCMLLSLSRAHVCYFLSPLVPFLNLWGPLLPS